MKRIRIRSQGFNVGWFFDPVYRANVELLWPVNGKQVKEYIERRYKMDGFNDQHEFGAKCVEVIKPDGVQYNVICLAQWPKHPDETDLAFLAHECFHCAEHILRRRSIALTTDATTEVYAYLIESIMRRCLNLLKG